MVKATDTAGHSHIEYLDSIFVCGTDTTQNLLLRDINAMLGRERESLVRCGSREHELRKFSEHHGLALIEEIRLANAITTTKEDESLELAVKMEEGDTRALTEWAHKQGLFQVTQVPGTPLSLSLAIETSSDDGLIVAPFNTLLTGTSMAWVGAHDLLPARVENTKLLVLSRGSKKLTVGAPSHRGGVVSHLVKGDDGIISAVLIDIPNLDSLINRARSKQALNRSVPANIEALP